MHFHVFLVVVRCSVELRYRNNLRIVELSWVKLISVTGPDSGRKITDEKCLHGRNVRTVPERVQKETRCATVV